MKQAGLAAVAALILAGCTGFGPDPVVFQEPIGLSPAEVARLNVTSVDVEVPASLTVSVNPFEQFPETDIVWYEDPDGDRRAQVDAIVTAAVGAALPHGGGVPARALVLVRKFHALTPQALGNTLPAWHDVQLDIRLVGADGTLLASTEGLNADITAPTAGDARAALAAGETQRSRITARIIQAVRLWLGSGA